MTTPTSDPPTCEEIARLNTTEHAARELTMPEKCSIMRHYQTCGECYRSFLAKIRGGREHEPAVADAEGRWNPPEPIPL